MTLIGRTDEPQSLKGRHPALPPPLLRRGARTSSFMHARAFPAGSRRAVAQTLAFTESLRLFVLCRDARRAQAYVTNER